MRLTKLLENYPEYPPDIVEDLLRRELLRSQEKVVVLDDDPTGTQTVHGLHVYTDWTPGSIVSGFSEEARAFFLLTNSRAFDAAKTEEAHLQIAANLCAQKRPFTLISRGDSTLRGHYPLETQTLCRGLKAFGGDELHGEILYPFFPEGGRYTADNIHYVAYGDELVPAGKTEFARDRTFGYHSSHLERWIEEKTGGEYPADKVVCITLDELRGLDYDRIVDKLCGVEHFGKVVVNSLTYDDVKVFSTAYLRAVGLGKRFCFRSAAALVKVLCGVPDKPLLTREELSAYGGEGGGLIVAGSHVQKTTAQLEALRARTDIEFIEVNQHLVVEHERFAQEIDRVVDCANRVVRAGRTAVVYTRRERFDLNTGNREDELRCAALISSSITEIVARLTVRPSFLIAKGGITSSDIGTKGLNIQKALVLGQILPGVPVWLTGGESRIPRMPYVIFPGNVGDEQALLAAVSKLSR